MKITIEIILLISCSLGAMEIEDFYWKTLSNKEKMITVRCIDNPHKEFLVPKKYINLSDTLTSIMSSSLFEENHTKTLEFSLISEKDFTRVRTLLPSICDLEKVKGKIYRDTLTDIMWGEGYGYKDIGSLLQAVHFLGLEPVYNDIIEEVNFVLMESPLPVVENCLKKGQSIEDFFGIANSAIMESLTNKCLERFKNCYQNKSLIIRTGSWDQLIHIYYKLDPENIMQCLALHLILSEYEKNNPHFLKDVEKPFVVKNTSHIAQAFKYLNQKQCDTLSQIVEIDTGSWIKKIISFINRSK